MTHKYHFSFLVILALSCILIGSANAQVEDSEFFPETGHFITGSLYEFYSSNPNARLLYGLPITEAFQDPVSGKTIQYFQKVRLEFHPDNLPGDQVRLTPLGLLLYDRGQEIPGLTNNTPNCFQETDWDFPVCYSFLEFYLKYGGAFHFGRPISGLEYFRGQLVQNFEFAHLIWKPDNPHDSSIIIAPLGLEYFYHFETDYSKLSPMRNFIYNYHISKIHLSVFPQKAMIVNGESLKFDVIARDQNNAPLAKGILSIEAHYPDGSIEEIQRVSTDKNGHASFSFRPESTYLGVIEVFVTINYNDLESMAVTSFRIWY